MVVPRGRTDGQADMTKLIVTFSNFVNVPKISLLIGPKVFKLTLLLSSLQALTFNHVPYIYKYSKVFQQYANEVHKLLSQNTKPALRQASCLPSTLTCKIVKQTAGKNKHYF